MAAAKSKTTKKPKKSATGTSAKPRNNAPARKSAPVSMEALQRYVRTRGLQFLDDPNVTSIGIGQDEDGEVCVQFTVGKKIPDTVPERLEALGTELLPKTVDVDGVAVRTDVIERTYKPAHKVARAPAKDPRKLRQNPVMPGISISHPSGTAGTLGAIVYDRDTGAPCLLSNWHVLHTGRGKLGDVVVQPGPYDDNRVAQNEVGTLLRSHLGPAGDCAIARLEHRTCDAKVSGLEVAITELAEPELGDRVVKSGRTTGVTFGVVRRVSVTAKMTYDGVGTQAIGGFEIGPPKGSPSTYEVSMGGDSGSAWLVAEGQKATGIMVGLHFAGEGDGSDDEHALACYATSVFEKLEIELAPPKRPQSVESAEPAGFQTDFLGQRVEAPTLSNKAADDVYEYEGSHLIPYTHFSVTLSKSRRFAHSVAWMIDGNRLRKEPRSSLKFKLDPRIEEEFQVGDELYANNRLDRGHIARRADLVWGSVREARQANADSFYFTNITPQHESYNQSSKHGLWGELENAIFEEVAVLDAKLVVFGGPIFKDNDPKYRKVKIPRSFWKVIAFVDADDEVLKAKAYVLSQDDLLNDLEAFDLDPFRLYQVSLADLEGRTQVRFGALKKADTFRKGAAPEGVGGREVREIGGRSTIVS